ncbi:MAG TPA: hypothetical protein ENF32_02600 [Thermosulfidibacter takaii]|uniref:Phage virion morphogenesis protein n=1 Tax=Thermosulfidibacter takaii TaxID=412593 RepID=A0A7C0U629_9BACT|nr:hypothetical protein [Thermosulfidibacter takaii]
MLQMKVEARDMEASNLLAALQERLANTRPLMEEIGLYLVSQTMLHFVQGGPGWPPLRPSTVARRRKGSAVPLRDTGRLMNSIAYKAENDIVTVGTNVQYAAVQQFGARRGQFGTQEVVQHVRAHLRRQHGRQVPVRAHERRRTIQMPWGDIPPRPFLYMTPQDEGRILRMVREHFELSG